jgi:ligand-binding sensor domain-containing protein
MVWIGTDKGLFSYDGYSYQAHFTYGTYNNSRIHCGITIGDKYLYFGADTGLLIYNYRADKYEEPKVTFPSDIRALLYFEGKLWIGTLNGLYVYNFTENKLQKIDRKIHSGLPHETIYSIIGTADKKLYIGTYNGLCVYSSSSDTFTTISFPSTMQGTNLFVNSLLEDTDRQCIWVGTEKSLFKYIPLENRIEEIEIFDENSVKSLALDKHYNLLAGTDNGLYIYHRKGILQHIVHDSRNTMSLSNDVIWNIFTDKENNIWR